jgi:quercetin dioxygenase-like cupin family protein
VGSEAPAQGKIEGTMRPLATVPFAPDPDVACLASAIETGEADKGSSTWILKAPAGCVVPWHSHTAQEQLIVVTGQVLAELSDHPSMVLGPGGYAMMSGRMAHQFTCQSREACVMFVIFDGPYDIKWGKQ